MVVVRVGTLGLLVMSVVVWRGMEEIRASNGIPIDNQPHRRGIAASHPEAIHLNQSHSRE